MNPNNNENQKSGQGNTNKNSQPNRPNNKELETDSVERPIVEKTIDSSTPVAQDKPVQEQVRPSVAKRHTITVFNSSNNTEELDFGRDKSVRIEPFGIAELDAELIKHPKFVAKQGILRILK